MASASSPLPPPPTRQLFVRFHGSRRPRSRRDVEELFSDFGRLKHAHHGQSGDVAFVTYWHLRDAREAVARLDGREYRGYELRVGHSRVTRLLAIGDVPRGLATPTTEALVREEVATYGAVAWTLLDANKNAVYVMMRSEADAARSTRELQGRERGGWRWEIEFYKENAIRPPVRTQSSLDTLAPATATPVVPAHHKAVSTPAQVPPPSAPPTPTPPPAPPAAASITPVAAVTPVVAATEKQNTTTRERSPSPRRSRSRSHSPPPRLRSISRSQSRSRSRSPPRKGRRRSAREERSPSHSSSSQSSSPSPPRKKGKRHARQPSQERSRSPAEPTPARIDRRLRSASPEAQPPPPPAAAIECSECLRLVTHLNKDHSISEDEQTKQLVKAWFNGNFELATKRDPSRKPESIRRLRFLDEHVNPFLESVGLATWTTRTPLYAHWFQRDVLRLSAAEVGHSRPQPWKSRTLDSPAQKLSQQGG